MSALFGINLIKGQKRRDSCEEVNMLIRDTDVIQHAAGTNSDGDCSPASNLTAIQSRTFSQASKRRNNEVSMSWEVLTRQNSANSSKTGSFKSGMRNRGFSINQDAITELSQEEDTFEQELLTF